MAPTLIELRPNRLLLDSNFDGYKLSLREIPCKKHVLSNPVDRILLNIDQYSLLHAKLFGLHNHLTGDQFDENDSVYFIDTDWNVCKTYIDPLSDELVDPIIVWQIPRSRERKSGDYNASLKYVTSSLAVIGDGTGVMYILDTGDRNNDDKFKECFSDEIAGQDEAFIIVDAVARMNEKENYELHVLLLSIKQENRTERFSTILHWITLSKLNDGHWSEVALKRLKSTGHIQYAHLEQHCEAVYVISDSECVFILNSDCPVIEEKIENHVNIYKWSQNIDTITIKIPLPNNATKELIHVKSEANRIEIKYNENDFVSGELYHTINSDMTTWSVIDNSLEILLNKNESGLMWPELVKDDPRGEHVISPCVEQVHERLGNLCSNKEFPPSGTTFNSQQVEECDFESDKCITFQRLCGNTNTVTHKANLGSHQVLMTASLNIELPPALGLRDDVDICLWQPQGSGNNFTITHNGTLLALGYVQASKQNRKFSVCPPNASYSVICESSGHLFIYRQKKPLSSSELRYRSTGRRVQNIAEQQVVNISNNEALGIYPSNSTLFLLCEKSILALKL